MREKIFEILFKGIALLLGLLFIVKFGSPAILRAYVESGVGTCEKTPILCMTPSENIINSTVDKEYLGQLLPYRFGDMEIYLPKGFTVVKEKITKVYYKKKRRQEEKPAIYLLHEKPDFFVNLFPWIAKQGVYSDYVFLGRTMYAKLKNIENLTNAFFVIMKSIFTPNLGDQKNIKMVAFAFGEKKGFINYNLTPVANYFDCNIIVNQGDFFKVYIKDKDAKLDLSKVLAIACTVKKLN